MPALAEFQNGIFVSGGYAGPPANAPVLRNAAGVSTDVLLAHDVPLPAGTVLSASVTAAGGPPALANTPAMTPGALVAEGASGGRAVPFGPPAAAAAGAGNAVLLPFVPDMISYVVISACAGRLRTWPSWSRTRVPSRIPPSSNGPSPPTAAARPETGPTGQPATAGPLSAGLMYEPPELALDGRSPASGSDVGCSRIRWPGVGRD
jgi:hypothetical protein